MRLVLDTNIVASGLFWGGGPAALLDAAQLGEIEIFTSRALRWKMRLFKQPLLRSHRKMHLKSILNHVEPLKSFVYRRARIIEVDDAPTVIEVDIEPRANGRPRGMSSTTSTSRSSR